MSRYIDADKFVANLATDHWGTTNMNEVGIALDKAVADVVEVRHGEWQYEQLDEYKFYKVTCPYCDAYYMGNYDAYNEPDDFNYCPNCGAKMDGERRDPECSSK